MEPADIPGDAEGRVAFFTVKLADDPLLHPQPAVTAPAGGDPTGARPESEGRGWAAVALLGLGLAALFVVGMLLTR